MPHPLTSRRSGRLFGRTSVPGDKSISHRALLLGALSTGVTEIEGLLNADDVQATARCIDALGARVETQPNSCRVIGRGVGGLRQPAGALDCGNSGTGARLLMGVIAGHDMEITLTGDASLSQRPMDRVLQPLQHMGLEVASGGNTLPLTLSGTSDLLPIEYELPVPSAQVKSAILLAGLHAPGQTSVIEPAPTRDHTERMLSYFGAKLTVTPQGAGRRITVDGDAELSGREVSVPADPSSAAFIAAAALITPESDVTVENVLINATRTGFYQCLQEMGADIDFENESDRSGEPVADIRICASKLSGIEIPAERAPTMIDEYPCLAILAALAQGETRMRGLAELRLKECDRLSATCEGLTACGVEARIEGDDLIVHGGGVRGGALVKTHMDHRIAMAFLTLGLASTEPISVDDSSMITTSFPRFQQTMIDLGAQIEDPGGAMP